MKILNKKFYSYTLLFIFLLIASLGFAFLSGKGQSIEFSQLNNLNFANGTRFDPAILDKKKKVFYFWATWCSTCSTNLPFIKTNYNYLSRFTDIAFVSIEEGDSKAELDKYMQEKNITFPVLFGNAEILKRWNIGLYPTTLFVNEKNEVRFVDTGIVNPLSFWVRLLFL
ncbi:MAG: redoxin family protein [Leptospira sp.]|nr:redoxin family protein [Leptospira sp.]